MFSHLFSHRTLTKLCVACNTEYIFTSSNTVITQIFTFFLCAHSASLSTLLRKKVYKQQQISGCRAWGERTRERQGRPWNRKSWRHFCVILCSNKQKLVGCCWWCQNCLHNENAMQKILSDIVSNMCDVANGFQSQLLCKADTYNKRYTRYARSLSQATMPLLSHTRSLSASPSFAGSTQNVMAVHKYENPKQKMGKNDIRKWMKHTHTHSLIRSLAPHIHTCVLRCSICSVHATLTLIYTNESVCSFSWAIIRMACASLSLCSSGWIPAPLTFWSNDFAMIRLYIQSIWFYVYTKTKSYINTVAVPIAVATATATGIVAATMKHIAVICANELKMCFVWFEVWQRVYFRSERACICLLFAKQMKSNQTKPFHATLLYRVIVVTISSA